MADVDLNQFYDTIAEEFASTLIRKTVTKVGLAQYQFWCPHTWTKHSKSHKPKLSVNFQKDVFHCWVCHFKGVASEYLKEHDLFHQEQKEIYEANKTIRPKEEGPERYKPDHIVLPPYQKITHETCRSSSQMRSAYQYLVKRLKCSLDFIEEFEIGVSEHMMFKERSMKIPNILVPSFDVSLQPNYYFQRGFLFGSNKKCLPRAEKTKIIAFESRIDWAKKNVVIVEGGYDSLRLWTLGIQNIPIFGTYLSRDWLLFQYLKMYGMEPVIFLDQTATEEARSIKERLHEGNVYSYVHDPYDDIKMEYPEEMRDDLDPAVLQSKHLLQLKSEFNV